MLYHDIPSPRLQAAESAAKLDGAKLIAPFELFVKAAGAVVKY